MHPILALQYQLDMILSEVCLTMLLSSFPRHESLPGAILLQPHLPSRLSISDSAIECWFDNWEPPLAVAANLQALAYRESETNNMLIQLLLPFQKKRTLHFTLHLSKKCED